MNDICQSILQCTACGDLESPKWYFKKDYYKTLCRKCYTKAHYKNPGVRERVLASGRKHYRTKKRQEWYKKYHKTNKFKTDNQLKSKKFRKTKKGKDYRLNYNKNSNVRFNVGKYRARKRKLTWTIRYFEYKELLNKPCFYCEKSLKDEKGVGLDRILNDLGYHMTNVLPCCGKCNKTRSNLWTVIETRIMIQAVKQYHHGSFEGLKIKNED